MMTMESVATLALPYYGIAITPKGQTYLRMQMEFAHRGKNDHYLAVPSDNLAAMAKLSRNGESDRKTCMATRC